MNRPPRSALLTLLSAVAAASCIVLLAGCGGGGDSSESVAPPPAVESVERDVLPADADPRIDTATEAHVAINPSPDATPAHKLFVFLPGTEGLPDMYRLILRSGAKRGFHTIGLNYPNPTPVGLLCASADPSCFWDVRREIITGADDSPLVRVDTPDSIVTRLAKAIAYLDAQHPDEGWGQFLDGTDVDWSKVVVGGHSQGGGHAGVMAKLYVMNRACYFASPADWNNGPVGWESLPNQTPAAAQYGFVHLEDTAVPFDKLSQIWPAMGLPGSARSVDGASSYGGAHMLTTDATPAGGLNPEHGATVIDAATPMTAAGQPLFDPVWGYMCFQ